MKECFSSYQNSILYQGIYFVYTQIESNNSLVSLHQICINLTIFLVDIMLKREIIYVNLRLLRNKTLFLDISFLGNLSQICDKMRGVSKHKIYSSFGTRDPAIQTKKKHNRAALRRGFAYKIELASISLN